MSRKLNVLYLLNHAGGGGSERYIESLIDGLDDRINPFFVYNEPGKLSEKLQGRGVPYQQLRMKSPFDLGAARKLSHICKEWKIDVIHTHFLRENAIAVWTKLFCKVRVVNTVHMQIPKAGLALHLNRMISRYCANIAVSNAVLENLKRECSGEIRMIYNGVPLPDLPDEPKTQLDRLQILSVGRFSPEKGMRFLIKAAEQLPELDFVLAGDGETLAECKEIAAPNVTFLGYVADTEPLYRSADLYVCPSLEEALGLSVLEAMSYGLPIVTTDVGGLPEIVNAASGIKVPSGDADAMAESIRQLTAEPQLMRTLGANARRRVEEDFNLESMSTRTFELYTEGLK